MNPLTPEDIYIGNFIIEIHGAIQEYIETYLSDPVSVAVDTKHYNLIKNIGFGNWVDKETMKLKNGIQILEETRWNGTFMSMRGAKYRR
ncbi:MAG: hypothetical protein KAY47_00355 [Prevotella sp.]|nr:hypothetical protein [Prevotella sp.]